MAEALVVLRDICVRHGASTVLDFRSLDICDGEVVVVIGPNGAGKSTLLRVMGLLQPPTSGKIYFCGELATPQKFLSMRRRMASVFQEPLLLDSTVYANAALGLKIRGFSRKQIDKKLCPWLERLEINHLSTRRIRTLSGGEAQRTSLVRGLVLDPTLLLLDEPFSALDAPTREGLLLDLQEILAETKITTVMVTHELQEAAAFGQRIGVLNQGRLLQLAPAGEIFAHPASEEVATLVGMQTRIPGEAEATSGGSTLVRFAGAAGRVTGDFRPGTRVTLCIRSEDIDLSLDEKPRNCSNNRVYLRATVRKVTPLTTHYRVALHANCGPLIALVPRPRFTQLNLFEGQSVFASFEFSAVHALRAGDL